MNCGHTGSVIGSPAKLDGFAQDLLTRALSAARQFYAVGHTYSGFGVIEAEKVVPAFAWAAPDFVPAAGPGQPNIAVADGQRLVLTSESEAGTIFCVEDDAGVTTYGMVAPGSGIDAGAVCEAGGWQHTRRRASEGLARRIDRRRYCEGSAQRPLRRRRHDRAPNATDSLDRGADESSHHDVAGVVHPRVHA